jgi:hypothetical protein
VGEGRPPVRILSALVSFGADLGARGRRLAIACPEGAARLVLDVSGVAERLPVPDARRGRGRGQLSRAARALR